MSARRALIVANDRYEHEGLRQLGSPVHDAEALQAVLGDPHLGRYDVQVVHNAPAHVLRRAIADFFADAAPDDTLLLHFSCHGLKNTAGELYLAATDTLPTRLDATAVSAQSINREMAESRSRRIVVLLDCCYAGAFSRGLVVRSGGEVGVGESFPVAVQAPSDGRGRVVMTASSATEYAFEDDRLVNPGDRQPSVFTTALVGGLRSGRADTDGDGIVDLDELYRYVHSQVTAATSGKQTPLRWGSSEGRLIVSWAPLAERMLAVPVPAELAARASGDVQTARLEAIRDLRQVLLGEDTAQAIGAMELLQRLATDDSQQICAAASAALDEAQLRVIPATIELGDLRADAPASTHTLRVVGSPLARVFQAASGARWLTVEQSNPLDTTDTWVKATINPAAFVGRGQQHAVISMTNRLGEIQVPVTAHRKRLMPPGMSQSSDQATWIRDPRLLAVAGIGVVVAMATADSSMLKASSFLGVGFVLLHAALLAAGLFLMGRPGPRRLAGQGLAAASAFFFLTDATANIYGGSAFKNWIEFVVAVAFIGLLGFQLWPFAHLLQARPRLGTPGQRPLAWIGCAAAVVQFALLFAAIDDNNVTITDVTGTPAALLAVVPLAGLCVIALLADAVDAGQRTFVTAAVLGYAVPELCYMLGSLLLDDFNYYGDGVWGTDSGGTWFLLMHAAVITALCGATLLTMNRPQQPRQ